MEIGLIALESDVEIRSAKAEGRHTRSARVLCWPRPFQGGGRNKEWNVGPINGWIGCLKIGTWRDGAMVQGHDRFHDPGDACSCLEVPNL